MYRCVLVQRETTTKTTIRCTDVFWFSVKLLLKLLLDVQMCFGREITTKTTIRCTDVFWFSVKLLLKLLLDVQMCFG